MRKQVEPRFETLRQPAALGIRKIPAKSHVKPWNHPNSKIKIAKPNKPNPLHAKNKSAKVGILVSLNSLK
jgi:hypothetical protein